MEQTLTQRVAGNRCFKAVRFVAHSPHDPRFHFLGNGFVALATW